MNREVLLPDRTPWNLAGCVGAPDFPLAEPEAVIWSASLEPGDAWLSRFRSVLSTDERDRADRFRFEKHRRRFTAARGILRFLLASQTGTSPESIRFGYQTHGKPFIEGAIRFNMSDSGPFAVYAMTLGKEVGIDIEQIREIHDAGALARRFFAPGEAEVISRTKTHLESAFFTCWTRKEAYIKARGEGLSMPLDSFEVSIDPAERPRLLSAAIDPGEVTRWSMDAFTPARGYIAAIVIEGSARLRHCTVSFEE